LLENQEEKENQDEVKEIDEEDKDQLDFESEIIETEVHFTFTNFILVMDEGEKKFVVLTKEMNVDLVKTTDGLDLEMSLLDFEVKREHIEESPKYMITSDYFSSLSSKIFKENIVQKQRKLINISFKQMKDQPQQAKIYFGCLFITLEPRIIKEFVSCLTNSLKTPELPKEKQVKTEEVNVLPEDSSSIKEIELCPKIYKHLENSDKKLNEIKEAKQTILVEVTIENISLLLVSTVNKTFIPLAQLMIEGGRVDCQVYKGAVAVDLKFGDLVCMDLTNYPNTLQTTDFDKIRPMKLFGRLRAKQNDSSGNIVDFLI
jgi:CxxC motif-containing protein